MLVATAWLNTPTKFLYWSVAYGGHCYWIDAVCEFTIWHPRHIHVCKPKFWWSLLTQHVYYSTRTLLTRCCAMCHCNEHIRTPRKETEGKHSTECWDRAVHKCKNIRLRECLSNSSRAETVYDWDGGHAALTVLNLNYTKIKNACNVRKKSFVWYYVAVMYSYWGHRTDTSLCEPLWSILLNCQFNDEAQNDAHIASACMRLF